MTSNLLIGYADIPRAATQVTCSGACDPLLPAENLFSRLREHRVALDTASESVTFNFDLGASTKAADFLYLARADELQAAGAESLILRASTQSAFTPQEISGLTLWLDANRGVTHSANAVSQWDDISGAGFDFRQSTAGSKPTLIEAPSGYNDNRAITFDGIADHLSSTIPLSSVITPSEFTAFLAVRFNTLTSGEHDIIQAHSGSDRSHLLRISNSRFYFYNWDSGGADGVTDGISRSTGVVYLVKIKHSGGNIYLEVDDSSESFTASGDSTNTNYVLEIGARNGASDFLNGSVLEVVYFNDALSAGDETRMWEYLTSKWKTAAILDTHTFNSATLTGPRSEDYFTTLTPTSAYRNWWVTIIQDASSANQTFRFSKLYLGSLLDLGKSPHAFSFNKTAKGTSRHIADSGATHLIRNYPVRYSNEFTFRGITDAAAKEFQDEVADFAKNDLFILYTQGQHHMLDQHRVMPVECKSARARKIYTDYNEINVSFDEVVG